MTRAASEDSVVSAPQAAMAGVVAARVCRHAATPATATTAILAETTACHAVGCPACAALTFHTPVATRRA